MMKPLLILKSDRLCQFVHVSNSCMYEHLVYVKNLATSYSWILQGRNGIAEVLMDNITKYSIKLVDYIRSSRNLLRHEFWVKLISRLCLAFDDEVFQLNDRLIIGH